MSDTPSKKETHQSTKDTTTKHTTSKPPTKKPTMPKPTPLTKTTGTPTPTPVSSPTPISGGFQGIYAFNTGNSSQFATNPHIAGMVAMRYWREINPSVGVYHWNIIDADMAPWIANNKQVIWRISTAGWKKWQTNQDSGHGTPQYVLDQIKTVVDDDGSVKPEYWNPIFTNALSTFVQAFAERYDGNKNILAVEIGIGDGGESKPDTSKASDVLKKWETIGYSDQNWWEAIQKIILAYTTNFKQTPLALMPDATFLQGKAGFNEATVTKFAAQHGCWLQWNGLVAGAKLPNSFSGLKTSVICEQLNAAGANKRSLSGDLQTAVDLGSVVACVFTSDLQASANAVTLQKFAAMVK